MPIGILNKTLIINGVSVTTEELRNSILDRNLPPPIPNEVKEGNYETFYEDIGRLFSLPNALLPETVQIDEDALEENGEDRRTVNLSQNKYQDSDSVVTYGVVDLIINPNIVVSGNYTSQNFGLVEGSGEIGIQNPFTSIDALRNTDFDSNLANIASERLQFAINEKVSQAILNETIDRVNLDPLSILQGNELIQSNYDITTQATIIGKGVELIGKITGTQLPISTIPKGAIGWQEFNQARANSSKLADGVRNILSRLGVGTQLNLTTEKRTDELLKRTGPGQKNALFRHLKLNRYVPNYSSPRLFGLLGNRAPNSRYYIGSEESTNMGYGMSTQFKAEDFLSDLGAGLVRPPENFTWGTQNVSFAEQTILADTKYIADQFSETDVFIDQTKKFFNDKLSDKIVSRGSAIKNNSGEYARVWLKSSEGSQKDQLEKGYSYQNAIRKNGLFTKDTTKPGFSVDEGKASLSVLQSNGIVKSYPNSIDESFTTYKKYMLSLENLAWSDNLADLPIQEIGPGDLVSGRKGRIMWFAPYDLSFDETTTANWNETNFLGRTEPLYTYNNTSRSGSFKFKILVDHPRIVNEYRGRQDTELEKFFAGITSPSELLSIIQRNTNIDQNTKRELEKKANSIVRQSKASFNTKTETFSAYFKDGSSFIGDVTDGDYNPEGLNDDVEDIWYKEGKIYDILKNTEEFEIKINIVGNRSNSGEDNQLGNNGDYMGPVKNVQKEVGERRSIAMKEFFNSLMDINTNKIKITTTSNNNKSSAASPTSDIGSDFAIKDRRVDVTITYFPKGQDSDDPQPTLNELLQKDLDIVSELFINETTYFDIIADDYPNYFDNISSRLTYFQPGFHSNTPEGLNTRLNFLQQCMRQGPSVYNSEDKIKPDNLAFGRPPICILRIGDFIHTKVVIKSLTINYAGGSNIQWDLNPEGIGVQPMLADVNMTIEIIGGQSLQGPINRLQNAMSYNFYANTEMYDPRADSIRLNGEGGEIVDGIKLSEEREKAGIDTKSLTKELKNELPIDQDATRLKAEANEQEEKKQRLFIHINDGVKEELYKIVDGKSVRYNQNKIIVISQSGETKETAESIRPGLLVDGSGENRLKVEISNSGEIIDGLSITEYNNDEPYSVNLNKKYPIFKNKENELTVILGKIRREEQNYADNISKWNQRKINKWFKTIIPLREERDNFIEQNIITLTVDAVFTKDESVLNRRTFSYKLIKFTDTAYHWELQK